MSFDFKKCKVCGAVFKTEGGLHGHIKKHKLTIQDYYTKYYPRKNKLTGDLLSFKWSPNAPTAAVKAAYFNIDFNTRDEMVEWCNTHSNKEDIKEYILKQLRIRIKDKKLKYGPNHLEIEISKLPPIDIYKDIFGGYGQACKELGLEPLYNKGINKNLFEKNSKVEEIEIHIDTREQKPLSFKNSKDNKLDFGDYTIGGDNYTYTYVDRKSESDFKATLGKTHFKRFREEIKRAKKFNSYIYIVTEKSLEQIVKNNEYLKSQDLAGGINMSFILHNMRVLAHEFKDNCQFVFSGSRQKSELLIPNLLYYGKLLWNVDIQYLLDHYDMD
mgnify:CR=1 FL=1